MPRRILIKANPEKLLEAACEITYPPESLQRIADQLEYLQKRFEESAGQYPGLKHFLANVSINPNFYCKKNHTDIWPLGDQWIVGKDELRGFFIKPPKKSWSITDAKAKFYDICCLAGQILVDKGLFRELKLFKGYLRNRLIGTMQDEKQMWILALHQFGNPIMVMLHPNFSKQLGDNPKMATMIEDVWLQSAFTCVQLSEKLKPESKQPSGRVGDKIIKLTDFIRENCEDTTSISSKANRIHEFVKKRRIKFMPKPVNKTKGNETKLYKEEELRGIWPKLKEKIKSLPNLKA